MRHLVALAMLVTACKSDASPDVKKDIATTTVLRLSREAFPQWAMANPSKACPASIADLGEYMGTPVEKDPWGAPYKILCGPSAPRDVKFIGIASVGPDGKEDTSDDLRSWEIGGPRRTRPTESRRKMDKAGEEELAAFEAEHSLEAEQSVVERLQDEVRFGNQAVMDTVETVVNAETEASREYAKQTLARLQREQAELEKKLRDAKAAVEKSRAAATPHVAPDCKADPTAVGCG